MEPSAFIEIETDFDYVQHDIQEKAARFLMDFYHVEGDLQNTIKDIAHSLRETAIQYLELQGISSTSNLARGIIALIRGPAIELRSTAYRMPTTGQYRLGGENMVTRSKQDAYQPKEIRGWNRLFSHPRYNIIREANTMVTPQGAKYTGATGGHWSLASKRQAVRDPQQPDSIIDYNNLSHARRYGLYRKPGKHPGTRNVQYYGAHVEFGHKTRDGGGIGFVQARPHLRPALRTVSDASTGWLSATMAHMLQGLGNNFDTIRHQGQPIHGLRFGNVAINQKQIGGIILGGTEKQKENRAMALRNVFSVQKGTYRFSDKQHIRSIGFGKRINYERYGYSEKLMRDARVAQERNKESGHRPPSFSRTSKTRARAHISGQYKYRSNLPPRESAHRKQKIGAPKYKKSQGPTYLGKNIVNKPVSKRVMGRIKKGDYIVKRKTPWTRKNKNNQRRGRTKDTHQPNIGRKGNRGPNPGGQDPLRPTTVKDFYQMVAKPDRNTAKELGMSKEEWNDWKQDYKDMKILAEDLSRQHNKRYLWLMEHASE